MINKMLLLLLLLINQSIKLIDLPINHHWSLILFDFFLSIFIVFFNFFFYFYLLIWTHSVEFLISYKYFFSSSLINFRWSRFFLAILSDISNRVIDKTLPPKSIHPSGLFVIYMDVFSCIFNTYLFFYLSIYRNKI